MIGNKHIYDSSRMLIIIINKYYNTTPVISKGGTFSPFLSLVILFSVLPSNFFVSGVKSSGYYPDLLLDGILFSIFLIYTLIGGLSVSVLVE